MVKEWEKRRFFLKGESKRKSNKEIIESEGKGKYDNIYIKFPGDELIPVTEKAGVQNEKKILQAIKERGGKKYLHLHTHPHRYNYYNPKALFALPSPTDVNSLIKINKTKAMAIAQINTEEGKLMGYTMLFKKSNAGSEYKQQNINGASVSIPYRDYRYGYEQGLSKENASDVINKTKKELSRGGIDIRFHPARGYYFDKNTGNYEKKKHNLEGVVGCVLFGFVVSFLFMKTSLTGAVIGSANSLGSKASLFFAMGLFLSGLVYFILKPYRK